MSVLRLRRSQPSTPQPAWSNVLLLLHCDGTNGSTTFTDSSSAARTMTAGGNAQITTAQSKFGGASGTFDGTGDYVKTTSMSGLDVFDGDYTMEAWARVTTMPTGTQIYPLVSVTQNLVGQFRHVGLWVRSNGVTSLNNNASGSGSISIVSDTGVISLNTWHHIAFSRSGSTGYLFVDGALAASGTIPDYGDAYVQHLAIGSMGNQYTDSNIKMFIGQIDDVRISKEAIYTAAFTPPSSAHPDS